MHSKRPRPNSSHRPLFPIAGGERPETAEEERPLVVIKLGGSALEPDGALAALQRHVRSEASRARVVLVHGGSPEISFLHELAGLPSRFVDGLRVTTDSGADLVAAALCGLVAPRVLRAMGEIGVASAAVSGLDADTLRASPIDAARLGRVGDTPTVEPGLIEDLVARDIVPVIAPVALGPDRETLNVNGDVAAGAIARSIGAARLDLVTTGPVRDADQQPVETIFVDDVETLIERGVVTDGMIPKLSAAGFALGAEGEGPPVPCVRVGGFTDFANGTMTSIEGARADFSELRATA